MCSRTASGRTANRPSGAAGIEAADPIESRRVAPFWLPRSRLFAMADGLLEAVRGLHMAHPELGPKPLLAKLRQQQPDLAAGNKEVREALAALKAEESKPTEAASAFAAAPAFSAVSASRTSLLPAARSGCCSRSLASSGLGPSSG